MYMYERTYMALEYYPEAAIYSDIVTRASHAPDTGLVDDSVVGLGA